jgi:hypothetical protein
MHYQKGVGSHLSGLAVSVQLLDVGQERTEALVRQAIPETTHEKALAHSTSVRALNPVSSVYCRSHESCVESALFRRTMSKDDMQATDRLRRGGRNDLAEVHNRKHTLRKQFRASHSPLSGMNAPFIVFLLKWPHSPDVHVSKI